MSVHLPPLLDWSRRLQAISQTGLAFAKDPYDVERYESMRELAAEIAARSEVGLSAEEMVDLFAQDVGYATPKVDNSQNYRQTSTDVP